MSASPVAGFVFSGQRVSQSVPSLCDCVLTGMCWCVLGCCRDFNVVTVVREGQLRPGACWVLRAHGFLCLLEGTHSKYVPRTEVSERTSVLVCVYFHVSWKRQKY